jgi:hypothetical protein
VDIPEPGSWWPLQRVEADDRAGQQHQGIEPLGVSLITDPQPPPSTKPRPGALNGPAVPAKPVRRLDHAAGDPRADAPPTQIRPAAAMVISLVAVDLGGSAPPAAGGHPDGWDVVQHGLEHGRVVGVGRAEDHRQRQPAAVTGQVQLGPTLAAIDRVCAGQVPL